MFKSPPWCSQAGRVLMDACMHACMRACMRVHTLSSQSRMENGHDDLRVKYDCYGPEGWSLLASCQVSRQVPQSSPDSPGKCGAHYYDWLFGSVLLLKGEKGWLGTKLTLYSCTGGQGLYRGSAGILRGIYSTTTNLAPVFGSM